MHARSGIESARRCPASGSQAAARWMPLEQSFPRLLNPSATLSSVGPNQPNPDRSGNGEHPPQTEIAAWVDWIGSQGARELDGPMRALVHQAFAAGFQAGWRARDDESG